MLKPIRLAIFAISIVGCSSTGSQTSSDLDAPKASSSLVGPAVIGAAESLAGTESSASTFEETSPAEAAAAEPAEPVTTEATRAASTNATSSTRRSSSTSSSAASSTASAGSRQSPTSQPGTSALSPSSSSVAASSAPPPSSSSGSDGDVSRAEEGSSPTVRPEAPAALTKVLSGASTLAAAIARAAPSPPREPATTAEVYGAVSSLDGLRGWTVIPLGHFQRGQRHVVVAWPAMNAAGDVVDATVVGICLEETAEGLVECGRRWVVRESGPARAAIAAALGGSDYRTLSGSGGASLDELGPRLSALGTQFVEAASSRNGNAARSSATTFAAMLPLSRVAYDDDVAQLLYLAARYDGRLEHVRTVRNGETAELTFRVVRSGLTMQTVRATARQLDGSADRWIIVSYS